MHDSFQNRGPDLDLNLLPAYDKWRVSGKDVVVSILDDGIEKDHPDLEQNYVSVTVTIFVLVLELWNVRKENEHMCYIST